MKLGQNYLIDISVAEREIQYANLHKDDVVLEVGPGRGILTKLLAQTAKKVIIVEIDEKLVEFLRNNLEYKNIDIIHKDIMKIDLNLLNFNKIVANLPFQISSPFTFKLLNQRFTKAVMIYQKEFAKRMIGKPGTEEYSRLSVALHYKAKCRILEIVSRKSFRPIPKVDGAIVEIIPRKKAPFFVRNEEEFFKLTKLLFSYRRKKIGNIVNRYYKVKDVPFSDSRVDELSPSDIGRISDFIESKKI